MKTELTFIEALVIVNGGWHTEEDRELLLEAEELLKRERIRIRLENQKRLIEEKLETFDTKQKSQNK